MHRLDSRFRGNDAGRLYRHITLNRTLKDEDTPKVGALALCRPQRSLAPQDTVLKPPCQNRCIFDWENPWDFCLENAS